MFKSLKNISGIVGDILVIVCDVNSANHDRTKAEVLKNMYKNS